MGGSDHSRLSRPPRTLEDTRGLTMVHHFGTHLSWMTVIAGAIITHTRERPKVLLLMVSSRDVRHVRFMSQTTIEYPLEQPPKGYSKKRSHPMRESRARLRMDDTHLKDGEAREHVRL